MNIRPAFPALLLAAASVQAAETGLVSIEWSPAGSFAHEAKVAPGKFVEVCGKLPAGAKVAWQFDAAAPLDFNIHYHEGKKVEFPVKQDQVAQSAGTLDAPVAQDYCWMWTNKGTQAAALKMGLKRP